MGSWGFHAQRGEQVQDASSVATYIPLAVALVAATSGVGIAFFGARSDALKRAERITAVSGPIPDGRTKDLVERSRDLIVLRYALRQAAPRYETTTLFALMMLTLAVAFALWGIREAQDGLIGWQGYVSISASGVAGGAYGLRVGRRGAWVRRRQRSGALTDDLN